MAQPCNKTSARSSALRSAWYAGPKSAVDPKAALSTCLAASASCARAACRSRKQSTNASLRIVPSASKVFFDGDLSLVLPTFVRTDRNSWRIAQALKRDCFEFSSSSSRSWIALGVICTDMCSYEHVRSSSGRFYLFAQRPVLSAISGRTGCRPSDPSATAMGFVHLTVVGLCKRPCFPKGLPPGRPLNLTPGLRGFHYPSSLSGSCPSAFPGVWKSLEATRLKAPAWVFTLEYRLGQALGLRHP
jgi:hypothetical protein